MLKQCEVLLTIMGVPCVQSFGEAEALCAQLDEAGLVDGCITQDGDCFLYGARTVYRNFSISHQGSFSYSVEEYKTADIEEKLALSRVKLIALSLLCGCD
jgi:flap endonuclease GEN